ncbi:MAG: hypothetical protein IT422_23515 [Pirellulaceae bacterium]|nr:hypothetical protein [Pirellulaceae bacterium]
MTTTQKVYVMLGNESLWEVAAHCHEVLSQANFAHSICGGAAVCLHGYHRNTTDVDLIIRPAVRNEVRDLLESVGCRWDAERKKLVSPNGVAIQFLFSGDKAGRGSEVAISDPEGDLNVEVIKGLSVVRLSRLIEMKIACGMANQRRTHKDFADVVELIVVRKLDGSFARFLHKTLRSTYRELVRNASHD